eukprot:gene31627-41060_t
MSFFGGSGRKKKFQSEDDDAPDYQDTSEEESRESWGTSKKTRKGSYFSNFESENESVGVSTDRDSYSSNDQFNRRKDPRNQINDEPYSQSMGRYSTEVYEGTYSEFEMAKEANLQVDESIVQDQLRQSTYLDPSRKSLNRTISPNSDHRLGYEKPKTSNELEEINATVQFDHDHSSTFQPSKNTDVDVAIKNNTLSPTNVIQDSGGELIDHNQSNDAPKSSLLIRQQSDASPPRENFSPQDMNQTKTAQSTPAAPLRSPINPIKATNSKYLQPFAKSSTCMLKPAVLFTRESCKRPITSLSRHSTGAPLSMDPSQRPPVRTTQQHDPSSPRRESTASKFSSRQDSNSAHSHRGDERQQSQSPSPSNRASDRLPKEITPEKSSEDDHHHQQQYLMSPNENPTRSSLPRQCEHSNSHNDRNSSPDMSALSTPTQSQLAQREQYSDTKRSRSDNYPKDFDNSPPVCSQESRLSGMSGGSAVSEAITSSAYDTYSSSNSSPTSTTTTPVSTIDNLHYSSGGSSGSRIAVTPPGDRGWAAQRAAMEEEDAAGGGGGGNEDEDVDVVQGCQSLDKKIQSLKDSMDAGRTLMQQEIRLHSTVGEKIAIATCKVRVASISVPEFCPHKFIDDDAAVEFLLEMSGPFPVEDKTTYFLSKWRSVLSSRNFISASLAWIAMIISTGFPRRAIAATAVDSLSRAGTILNPSGWDLFGRVPFDDFLFSTWQLTEPNLLRRTMQEAIAFELPISLANYRRSKMISDLLGIAKGCGLMMFGIYILGFIIQRARLEIQKDREREAAIRGFFMPISALYKGKERLAGKELDGMDGWIDMRRDVNTNEDDDDDDDEDQNGDAEPSEEDGDGKKGGGNDSPKDKDKDKGKGKKK